MNQPNKTPADELRQKIISILGLEKNLADQLVPSSFEHFQSDWTYTVEELMEAVDAYVAETERLARIDEVKKSLKLLPALDKHSGASWYRGYVSAQYTLRQKLKKRLAQLTPRKELSV